MKIAIAAVDKNFGIGYKNDLLFRIPEDQKFFKEKTMGNVVVMGRKTFESLKLNPLSKRNNIVITSRSDIIGMQYGDDLIIGSLENMKHVISYFEPEKDIYIIGGAKIYKEFIDQCDMLYLTQYAKKYDDVDSYFPLPFDHGFFLNETLQEGTYNNYKWCISSWVKK